MLFRVKLCLNTAYSVPWSWTVNCRKFGVLSALASLVLVSETWFIFTYEIDVYIAECVVFKMRYATAFNKFAVNSAVLSYMILLSWHTIIQKGNREA